MSKLSSIVKGVAFVGGACVVAGGLLLALAANSGPATTDIAPGIGDAKTRTVVAPPIESSRLRVTAAPLSKDQPLKTLTLGSKNMVLLRGPVTDKSVADLQNQVLALSHTLARSESIYLVLDTPGGSIPAGVAFIETARGIPQKVKTVTMFAASMGFHIAQNLDTRYIAPNGTLMSHRATFGGVGGEVGSNGEGQLVTRLNWSLRSLQLLDFQAATRMGLALPLYQQMIANEYWVDGQDAVNAKAADEVIQLTCSQELIEKRTSIVVETLFGNLQADFSGCPLISYPLSVNQASLKFPSTQSEEAFKKFSETLFGDRTSFVKKYMIDNSYRNFLK